MGGPRACLLVMDYVLAWVGLGWTGLNWVQMGGSGLVPVVMDSVLKMPRVGLGLIGLRCNY